MIKPMAWDPTPGIPLLSRRCFAAVVLVCLVTTAAPLREAYDPLASLPDAEEPACMDLVCRDEARERDIPVRVWTPPGTASSPVVLFSHGLGGDRHGSAYLGEHWASRGYAVVFVQHPGSDDAVWRNRPGAQRLSAMKAAANRANFMLRVGDVPAVLDQLAVWDAAPDHPFSGRLDLSRVGMSGHSFGAVTTQAVSGQVFFGSPRFTDVRIKAAIALSPSCPRRGEPRKAFGGVTLPWMVMTGTRDISVIGGADAASRLSVYRALPPGHAFELVLFDAEHSAFTDRALPGDRQVRNPNHHRAILALSTAFLDAYLKGDATALAWLRGDGPETVLEAQDHWQWK